MRKTHSSPSLNGMRRSSLSCLPPANTSHLTTPPISHSHSQSQSHSHSSLSSLVENIDHLVPATVYQYSQCMESYGFPKEILEKTPTETIEERVKDQIACMVIPDEPNEDPMMKLRQYIRNRFQDIETLRDLRDLKDLTNLNERFDRLFLSVRRGLRTQRRRYTIH